MKGKQNLFPKNFERTSAHSWSAQPTMLGFLPHMATLFPSPKWDSLLHKEKEMEWTPQREKHFPGTKKLLKPHLF
ncbi:hypothetical protein JTE90_010327 [Oedothorax gibbosus]|uniref:Uncharacterized protein n=1 Tax=Oedothorax gibbosus TaxID=931172 RepID=A0AAV6TDB6_9ARAC|nr:hypothetical protein JTE90_010327 [Oedothorax gibbosus]